MISEVPYRSLTEHRGTLQQPHRTQGYPTGASENTDRGTLRQLHRTQGYVPYSSLTEHRGTASAAVHNASDSERHRVQLGLGC